MRVLYRRSCGARRDVMPVRRGLAETLGDHTIVQTRDQTARGALEHERCQRVNQTRAGRRQQQRS